MRKSVLFRPVFKQLSILHVLTYSILIILVLPDLVQEGMFMDGTQYACVARNMAEGKGSFWFPHLSDSWFKNGSNAFMEHLPLTYFLQAKFFVLFGDGIYTEKIYGFCCLLVSVLFIQMIWGLLPFENPALKRHSWLPVLLWITCGSVYWAYRSNMLEITVTVFVLASTYFMLKAIYGDRWNLLNVFLSGGCAFLACLSKGPPGLFPLAGFALFYISSRRLPFSKAILYTMIVSAIPFTVFAGLFLFDPFAAQSLRFYVTERLLHRVSSDPLVENRLTVLFWVLTDMLAPIAFGILSVIIFRVKAIENTLTKERKELIVFFILLGLAGIIPLTFTPVQRAVYFVPALPFLAMGIALLLVNGIEEWKKRIARHYQKIKYASFALLAGVILTCVFLAGKTSRDEEMLDDVRKICENIPKGSTIDATRYVYELWVFQFYLLRYRKITLWPEANQASAYFLCEKTVPADFTNGMLPLPIELKNFKVFKKK